MLDLFLKLAEEIAAGKSVVLLTIVESSGSTPRSAGSHQLVLADGTTVGTVGGGYQEHLACEAGRVALQEKTSRLLPLVLHPAAEGDIGAVCGGELRVFCQYLDGQMPGITEFLQTAVSCLKENIPCRLYLDLTEPAAWGMALWQSKGKSLFCGQAAMLADIPQDAGSTGLFTFSGRTIYREILVYPRHVIVFGGGHVALAHVPLLTGLGFSCTVVEDRHEYATASRFPTAIARIVTDFADLPDRVPVTGDDYVCIMTRGHVGDYDAQKYVLSCQPCYIGVIGSRTKLAFIRKKLLADGFTAAEIDACHAPIGLPISAATPEEIAVSVAAELIAVRARREGREKGDARSWRVFWNENHRL